MKDRFLCKYLPDKEMKSWYIDVIPALPFDTNEYEVSARYSTFFLIVDRYSKGMYLCIPNWNIGMEIVDGDDYYWNYSKLSEKYPQLSKVDRISIVNALSIIKHYNED